MFLFGAQPKPTISAHKKKHWPLSGPASQCARRIVNQGSNSDALTPLNLEEMATATVITAAIAAADAAVDGGRSSRANITAPTPGLRKTRSIPGVSHHSQFRASLN